MSRDAGAGFIALKGSWPQTTPGCGVGDGKKKAYIADYAVRYINGEKPENIVRTQTPFRN